MASIQLNNITFSNVDITNTVTGVGTKYVLANIVDGNGKYDITKVENGAALNNPEYFPFVNAIDIDWNGAQLTDNITINTTGQLLKIISDLYNEIYPQVTYSLSFTVTPNNKEYDFYTYIDSDNIIPGKRVFIYNNLTYEYKRSNFDIHIIKAQSGEEINFTWVSGNSTRFTFIMPEEDVNIVINVTEPENEYDGGIGSDDISYASVSLEINNELEGLAPNNFHITANDEEITSLGVASGAHVRITCNSADYEYEDLNITGDIAQVSWNSLGYWEFFMPSYAVRLTVSKANTIYNDGTGGFDNPNSGN